MAIHAHALEKVRAVTMMKAHLALEDDSADRRTAIANARNYHSDADACGGGEIDDDSGFTDMHNRNDKGVHDMRNHVWFTDVSILSAMNFMLGLQFGLPETYFSFLLANRFTPSQMQMITAVMFCPWMAKPVYAIAIDRLGMRPQQFIHMFLPLVAITWCIVAVVDDYKVTITLFVFISMCLSFTDVALDTIMVLRAKIEGGDGRKLQSQILVWRCIGMGVGAAIGGWVVDEFASIAIFTVVIASSVLFTAISCLLDDVSVPKHDAVATKTSLVSVIRNNKPLQLALLFTFIVNGNPEFGGIFDFYQIRERHFTPMMMGVLDMIGYIGIFLGASVYTYCVTRFNNRLIMRVALLVVAVDCFIFPVGFILRWNEFFNMSDGVWSVFSGFFRSAADKLMIMPITGAIMPFCVDGHEGTIYALFTAMGNVSTIIAMSLGASIAELMGISESNMDNLWIGYVAKACVYVVISFCVGMLPKGEAETNSTLDDVLEAAAHDIVEEEDRDTATGAIENGADAGREVNGQHV